MPYISKNDDRREKLRDGEPALTAGELNYQIFYYIKHFFDNYNENNFCMREDIKHFVKNFLGMKPNYQRYNDMTGVLVRCYKEIDRRVILSESVQHILIEIMESYDEEIADYEDKKIKENSDVE